EDETSWGTGGSPDFLGVSAGPIRVIRGVEGAKSGRQTTKYEFIYPTMFQTRVNLRVHNLNYLHLEMDHEDGFANDSPPGYLWSGPLTTPPAIPGNYLDKVDGLCTLQGGTCHPLQFEVGNWMQMNSPLRGGYVQVLNELRPIPLKSQGIVRSTMPI